MYKSLAGLAAAAVLTTVAASSPANAFVARHAPGVAQDQATIEHVWHRGYPHRRYYRYGYRAYPYYGYYGYRRAYPYYGGYYGYRRAYPYYGGYGYYGPRVGVGIGPFGFGVW